MNLDDSILISRLKQDDVEAFEELYERYKRRVFSFAARYLKSQADIEETVQQIFVKIWENRYNIKQDCLFYNYLFTITKNTIFHGKQKKVNEQAYINYLKLYLSIYTYSTEDEIYFSECREHIDKAIDKLPPKRREIFLLNRQEGLTYKEIAEKTNTSLKTVESHMRLALRDLRKELESYL